MTRWPIFASAGSTSGPIAATTPHGSCPAMVGLGLGGNPVALRGWLFGPAVLVQVGPAHAGRLHLDHDLAGARGRVGERHQFQVLLAGKHDALHGFLRHFALEGV